MCGIDTDGITHALMDSTPLSTGSKWRVSSYAAFCQRVWIETPTDEDTRRLIREGLVVDCIHCIAKGLP